jgi:hypothetical protein
MARRAFLGFRLKPELKMELEEIAKREERSLSQVCEILLRNGIDSYKKGGSTRLQHLLSRPKKKGPSE